MVMTRAAGDPRAAELLAGAAAFGADGGGRRLLGDDGVVDVGRGDGGRRCWGRWVWRGPPRRTSFWMEVAWSWVLRGRAAAECARWCPWRRIFVVGVCLIGFAGRGRVVRDGGDDFADFYFAPAATLT